MVEQFQRWYSQRDDGEVVDNCSKIWRCDVPSKVHILVWKVLLNRLQTRDTLVRRGIIVNEFERGCGLCFFEEETVNHLFCQCRTTRRVWEAILQWLGVNRFCEEDVNSHFISFGMGLKGRKLRKVKYLVWMAVVWALWHERNPDHVWRQSCKWRCNHQLHQTSIMVLVELKKREEVKIQFRGLVNLSIRVFVIIVILWGTLFSSGLFSNGF